MEEENKKLQIPEPFHPYDVPSSQNDELCFQFGTELSQDYDTIPREAILDFASGNGSGANPFVNDCDVGEGKRRKLHVNDSKAEETNIVASIGSEAKKIMHRDFERQRRQEMANLYTSLRDLLPFEYIKGKRAISDHMQEAVNYIKDLQKNIKELGSRRDDLRILTNSNNVVGSGSDNSSSSTNTSTSNAPACVMVRSCLGGIEIVINSGIGEQTLHLSGVLELLQKEGLNVVCCVSTKVNGRLMHTIQSEVSHPASIDIAELQNRLTEAIQSQIKN